MDTEEPHGVAKHSQSEPVPFKYSVPAIASRSRCSSTCSAEVHEHSSSIIFYDTTPHVT